MKLLSVASIALAALLASACSSFDAASTSGDGGANEGGGDGGANGVDPCAGADYCETFDALANLDQITRDARVSRGGSTDGMSLVGALGAPERALQIQAPAPLDYYDRRIRFVHPSVPPKLRLAFDITAEGSGGFSIAGFEMPEGNSYTHYLRLTLRSDRSLYVDRTGQASERMGTLAAGRHRIALELDTRTGVLDTYLDGVSTRTLKGTSVPSVTTGEAQVSFGPFSPPNEAEAGTLVYDNVAIRLK